MCLCTFSAYLLGQSGELGYRTAQPNGRGEAFVRMTTAMKFIDRQRQGHKVVFWYDKNDRNDPEFESINSIYMWGFTWIGRDFPALNEGARGRTVAGTMVAILTTDFTESTATREANQTLSKWGLLATPRGSEEISGPTTHYRVVCLDLHRLAKQVAGASDGGATPDLAVERPANESSTLAGGEAGRAVDGDADGIFAEGSVTHTGIQKQPWWQVDLGTSATVNFIVVWNRTDAVSDRLSDYWVFLSDQPFLPSDTPESLRHRAGTWSSHQTAYPNPSAAIAVNGARGRYVRVQLSGTNYLSLAEVQVF